MSRWFRFYDDVINDPKVLKLPEGVRWSWVAILCIASKNSGVLPTIQDTAFLLRMNVKKTTAMIEALIEAGLLDKTDDSFAPHNWGGRQFLSDGSAERVRRHREKRAAAGLESQWSAPKSLRKEVYSRDNYECVYCGSPDNLSLDHKTPESRGGTHDVSNLQTACMKCNGEKRDFTHEEYVTRNVGVTLQKRPQTTETEQNRTDIPKPAAKPTVERDPVFDELRKAYPRRKGGDPGPPAAKLFLAAVKAGTDPQIIIDGAKRFAVEEHQNINTPYIPQLVKWLRDKRWLDHPPAGGAQQRLDIRSSLI